LVETLFRHYMKYIDQLPQEYINLYENGETLERVVCDYVGSMTDHFAIRQYEDMYIPKSWHKI